MLAQQSINQNTIIAPLVVFVKNLINPLPRTAVQQALLSLAGNMAAAKPTDHCWPSFNQLTTHAGPPFLETLINNHKQLRREWVVKIAVDFLTALAAKFEPEKPTKIPIRRFDGSIIEGLLFRRPEELTKDGIKIPASSTPLSLLTPYHYPTILFFFQGEESATTHVLTYITRESQNIFLARRSSANSLPSRNLGKTDLVFCETIFCRNIFNGNIFNGNTVSGVKKQKRKIFYPRTLNQHSITIGHQLISPSISQRTISAFILIPPAAKNRVNGNPLSENISINRARTIAPRTIAGLEIPQLGDYCHAYLPCTQLPLTNLPFTE